jgi:SAM-dependent methyltransferase
VRATAWSYADPALLQDVGAFSRSHAVALTRSVVPTLDGLGDRLRRPGAAFLDIGVGVAGTASAMAELWPELQVVGIDVWQPSLALARENVRAAGLGRRIELREQAAEALEDDAAFDLAWMPIPFLPERVLPAALGRTLQALRPGGWLVVPFMELDGLPPVGAALWKLRLAMFGGPVLTTTQVEELLRGEGYADVHVLPRHPGVPAAFAVGRRPTA